MKKLKSKKGETLAEVLVAVLIVAVSTSLFLGMVSAASHINRRTEAADTLFYSALSQLECFEADDVSVSAGSGKLSVERTDGVEWFRVEVYAGDDMISYRISGEGEE